MPMPFPPRSFIGDKDIDDIKPEDVVVAANYEANNRLGKYALPDNSAVEEQDAKLEELMEQLKQDHPEIEFSNDYNENIAKQQAQGEVEAAKKEFNKAGKSYDMNYIDPLDGVVFPCKIITNANGVQVPVHMSPYDIDNPEADVAMVYFDTHWHPLYEADGRHLKVQTSQSKEYDQLNYDDNAPIEVRTQRRFVKQIIDQYERKHPIQKFEAPKVQIDANQYALLEIAKHLNLDLKFENKQTFNWKDKISNQDIAKLLNYYKVSEIDKDKIIQFEEILIAALKQKMFDLSKIVKKQR